MTFADHRPTELPEEEDTPRPLDSTTGMAVAPAPAARSALRPARSSSDLCCPPTCTRGVALFPSTEMGMVAMEICCPPAHFAVLVLNRTSLLSLLSRVRNACVLHWLTWNGDARQRWPVGGDVHSWLGQCMGGCARALQLHGQLPWPPSPISAQESLPRRRSGRALLPNHLP